MTGLDPEPPPQPPPRRPRRPRPLQGIPPFGLPPGLGPIPSNMLPFRVRSEFQPPPLGQGRRRSPPMNRPPPLVDPATVRGDNVRRPFAVTTGSRWLSAETRLVLPASLRGRRLPPPQPQHIQEYLRSLAEHREARDAAIEATEIAAVLLTDEDEELSAMRSSVSLSAISEASTKCVGSRPLISSCFMNRLR
jgi:hypothetical protein